MLPKDSDGLAAFNALRRAHFGPEIDVALAAPRGTLLEPGRLGAISRLERQIEKLPLIRAVTGPGLIADATAEVRKAPKADRQVTTRSDVCRARAHIAIAPTWRAQRDARQQASDVSRGSPKHSSCLPPDKAC